MVYEDMGLGGWSFSYYTLARIFRWSYNKKDVAQLMVALSVAAVAVAVVGPAIAVSKTHTP